MKYRHVLTGLLSAWIWLIACCDQAEVQLFAASHQTHSTGDEPNTSPKQVAGNQPRPVSATADGSLTLPASAAGLFGPSVKMNTTTDVAAWWSNQDDRAVWTLQGVKEGNYDVMFTWGVPDDDADQEFVIELDGRAVLAGKIPSTGGYDQFQYSSMGQVKLTGPTHRLTFRPADKVRNDLVDLHSIAIVPTGRHGFRMPAITVPPGFKVELAAGPPLVKHPMMACLDERGRLFVAESAGVNRKSHELLEERPHKILLLEDTDNDGRYDKRTVFAENLVLPNGAEWHDGALYVCSAPYLWRFEDTDGDGQADHRTPILGTFGFNGMSSAFHGPVLGPDGRLYLSGGQHGWRLDRPQSDENGKYAPAKLERNVHGALTVPGPWTSTAPGVFSCWPDGSAAQCLANGGVCNPVETTFTAEGEVLGTVAVYDSYQGGRRDAVLHWIDGGVFNLAERNYQNLKRTGKDLTPLSYRGHVAPSGIMRYRGSRFGPEYRDNVFFTEFNTHKVYRLAVTRHGATFTSRDEVFLSSPDTDTHFTDVMQDADGSLLVIDTGGWFLYGCPTSRVAKPSILGGIYRISKVDVATQPDPWGRTVSWKTLAGDQLAALLDDARPAVRDRAIEVLAKRGAQAVNTLQATLHKGSPLARRNAIWALTRIDSAAARDAVRTALVDRDLSVRLAATRSVSIHRDADALDRLATMVMQDDPAIRREAATALGRIGKQQSVPTLLASLPDVSDRFLEHALIYALIRIGDRQGTLAGLNAPAPQVRRAALVALDQMNGGNLTRQLVAPLLDTDDQQLQRTVLEVIARREGWADEIHGLVAEWLRAEKLSAEQQSALCGVLLAFSDDPSIEKHVAESLSRQDTPLATRLLLLDVIARGNDERLPRSWSAQLAACLDSDNIRIVRQAIAAVAGHDTREFDQQLVELAQQTTLPSELRVAALAVLAENGKPLSESAFDFLASRAAPDVDSMERLAAARALGAARLEGPQLRRLASMISRSGPLETPSLVSAFAAGDSEVAGLALVGALVESPGLISLQGQRLRDILQHYPDSVKSAAQPLLEKLRVDPAAQTAQLEALQHVLTGGDPARGRELFFGKRASCSACHRVGSEGGNVGPNLSQIGSIRTRRDLLEAVIFPSASLARGFESFQVLTETGQVATGVVGRETVDAIYLRGADRSEMRIPREQIDEIVPISVSAMPQGLDKTLTPAALRDLLAYLDSLKTTPP